MKDSNGEGHSKASCFMELQNEDNPSPVCRGATLCISHQHILWDHGQKGDEGHGGWLAEVHNRSFQLCSHQGQPLMASGQGCQNDMAAGNCGSAL